jgi:hypothetical protein
MCFREVYELELILFFVFLYPFMGFTLRVDEQGPTCALGGNHAVVDTQGIIGETFDDPFTDGERGLQRLTQGVIFRVGNA